MPKRNRPALQNLYRVVESAPDDLLHMRSIVEPAPCGTARCALGWAIIDPWFQQETAINQILAADHDSRGLETYYDRAYLSTLFGLSESDCTNLFALEAEKDLDPHAISKAEVLANITRLLAGRHALCYKALR